MAPIIKRMLGMLLAQIVMILSMVGLSMNEGTETAVPAVYIFGDSTFDVGTNLWLPNSSSQADMPFYGIDFPNSQITGRFSNGYNLADTIVQLLGFKQSAYPFLYLIQNDTKYFKTQILKGVNLASGGSGLLDDTGTKRFNMVISMAEQILQFASVRSNISEYLNDTAESTINKSLFLLTVGINDLFEFFLYNSIYETKQDAINKCMQKYQSHIQTLWKLGARKFGILNIPPLGCFPLLRLINGSDFQCEEEFNAFSQQFNTALEGLLQNLSSKFPKMKYSIGHSYEIAMNIINHPHTFGYKEVMAACCGDLTLNVYPCGPDSKVCKNRNAYLFWDQYHPTQNASHLIAQTLFNGGTEFVTPFNFSQLVLPS